MFFSEKGNVKTITLLTLVFFSFSFIGVWAAHVWGPGQPGYLEDPLWPVGPEDLESRDKLVAWLKKPEIRASVKELYKSKPGAYEAIYDVVENHPEQVVMNAPASTNSNLGMINCGASPFIIRDIAIVLSKEKDLRVALIGPIQVGGFFIGMQIPYKTIDAKTGKVEVSCYNIYGHFLEAPSGSPTPQSTPPSQKTPVTPPTVGPTPSPTLPCISFPTPCRFSVSGSLQGGNTYQITSETSYETKKLLDFWGFFSSGESQTTAEKATPTCVGTPTTPGPTTCPSGTPNQQQTPGPTSVPTQVIPPPAPTATPQPPPTAPPTPIPTTCISGTPTPGVNGPHDPNTVWRGGGF